MEFKGTKGKWNWISSNGNINRLAILENEYGSEICNFGDNSKYYPTEGVEPDDYDKKLIAAAPEMFEMLKELKNRLEYYMDEVSVLEIEQLLTKITSCGFVMLPKKHT